MSTPSQFGPPPQQSGGGITWLVVLLVILVVLLLACGGLCAGCVFVAQRAGTVLEKGLEEGMQQLVLLQPYAEAHAAVQADQRVIDRLGEPIEAIDYKRQSEGKLNTAGETLQFDIKGPKGTGIVSVVATPEGETWKARTITVTFEDGSVIDVPPPADQ
jgi:hypothetical protein